MANIIAREADLVIGVGTRYTDFTTSSKWLFREDAKFVNINVSAFQALKMDAVPVIADAKAALPKLALALDGYQTAYTGEITKIKAAWNEELNRLDNLRFTGGDFVPEVNDANAKSAHKFASDLNAALTQTEVLGAVNRLIADDAVVVGSSGSLPGCMQRMWRPKARDTYNMEYGYSCMGYEICGALGVKLAVGDRDVYSMVGDGSFVMLHSELLTAVQERIKIHVVLFDNASFGCINNLQVGQGNRTLCSELRYRSEPGKHEGDFLCVDYAKIAEGYGCAAYTIRTMTELEQAFEDAKKVEGKPVLFDIKVLPKSMTDGYDSWWRVGSPEVGGTEENRKAYEDLTKRLKDARKY